MGLITEAEFARIADGIFEDRESIIRHNPIGSPDETLLWMMMSALTMYLSLSEIETPCFTGRPDAETYRQAILYMLEGRMAEEFDPEIYLRRFSEL